jgi:uncharacterized membrane protein (DUF485 family)
MTPEQRKADLQKSNLRLALILASIALVFFVGFVAEHAFFAG